MSKLGQATLTDGVIEELITYLRDGTINERAVTRALAISDFTIEDFGRLKRIHFCLSDAVVQYVENLQERLRRVKTANRRERQQTRGAIRGAVDWQATTRLRYAEGGGDRTKFSCKTPYTEYDIDENLVVKKLLWVIHSTVQDEFANIDYEWRTDAWPSDRITMFDRIYARNVHLNRIQDGESITVTPRMLNTARSARYALYTTAYTLYDRYRRLMDGNYNDDDIVKLLSDTLIIPERLPRLFELFCVFRLLRALERTDLRLQPVERGSSQIARLESDQRVVDVYHDASGGLSFHVPFSEIEAVDVDYFQRYRNAIERHQELIGAFLGRESHPSLYSGRPDLLIEVYDSPERETPTDVCIGEIKYSDNLQTFSRGLKELIEYMEFAQKDGYLSDAGVSMQGLLITDGASTETASPLDEPVTHLTAAELANKTGLDERALWRLREIV